MIKLPHIMKIAANTGRFLCKKCLVIYCDEKKANMYYNEKFDVTFCYSLISGKYYLLAHADTFDESIAKFNLFLTNFKSKSRLTGI
jgi:hypothetical protein